jgi:putative ABC transport system permease protein
MALLVRTHGDPASFAPAAGQALRRVDVALASYDVMTMDDRRAFTQWGERFIGRTFAAFAIAALLLACVGAYGLTAYSAAQRTKEIGLRMAIGATRRDVIALLMGRGLRLAALGLLMGLPLAVLAARALEGLLFRVAASDLRTWIVVAVALMVPLLAANLVPARRASRLDPADALRYE